MALPANFLRQLMVGMVICIGFYGAWIAFSGAAEVRDAVMQLGWYGWGVVLGLSLFNYALRFARWEIYLRVFGHRIPFGKNLCIYLAGFGFTTTPGKVGEALRSVYLKPYGVGYTHSLAAFFAERLVDMLAMIVVASLAAWAFTETRWLLGVMVLLVLLVLPAVHSAALLRGFSRLNAAAKSDRVRSIATRVGQMLGASAALLRSLPLYAGFGLGLVAWFAEGYALYVVLERMNADIPLLLAAGIYGVSIVVGAVSFIPGGLGSTEVAMGGLLVLSGVSAPVAVSAVIICRLATLWFAVLIGLGCLGGLELRGMKSFAAGDSRALKDN